MPVNDRTMHKSYSCILVALLFTCICMGQHVRKPMDDGSRVDSIANGGIGYCGFDAVLRGSRSGPLFRSGEEKMNRQILDFHRVLDGDSVTLPVVFHIINDDPGLVPDQ